MLLEIKWEGMDFNTICILQKSFSSQENDSHVPIKYCDSNTLYLFNFKKTSHLFSHLMLSLLISIAHREPQSRIFEHSAWCHPPRNCKQWYIHGGLWALGFTSGLTFLNLFK